MSTALVNKLWKYKGEKADYDYYRQRDKITPDSEVMAKLELIHQWYPDKTLVQLQGKDEEIKNKFLRFFPQADMHQFTVMDHPDTGTNVFSVRGRYLVINQLTKTNSLTRALSKR